MLGKFFTKSRLKKVGWLSALIITAAVSAFFLIQRRPDERTRLIDQSYVLRSAIEMKLIQARQQLIQLSEDNPAAHLDDFIQSWSEYEIVSDPQDWILRKRSTFSTSWSSAQIQAFEKEFAQIEIEKVKEQLNQGRASFIIRLEENERTKTNLLGVGFLLKNGPELTEGRAPAIEKSRVLLGIVKAENLFSALRSSYGTRSYVASPSGYIYFHSSPGYAASYFSHASVFKDGIQPLFKTGKTASFYKSYTSIDQMPVHANLLRIPDFELALVVEKTNFKPSAFKFDDPQPLVAGIVLVLALMFLGSVGLLKFRRRKNSFDSPIQGLPTKQPIVSLKSLQSLTQQEASKPTPKVPVTTTLENPLSFVQRKTGPQILAEFEKELHALALLCKKSGRILPVEQKLAQAASKLCDSPILYFTYESARQSTSLKEATGFKAKELPGLLGFPLPGEMNYEIIQGAAQGRIASLAQFKPLADLLLNVLGVAHFEAWTVTQTHPKTDPSLQGVLVVLHAGIESNRNREYLFRMIGISSNLIHHEGQRRKIQHPLPQRIKPSDRHRSFSEPFSKDFGDY